MKQQLRRRSFPKSGRSWLCDAIRRVWQRQCGRALSIWRRSEYFEPEIEQSRNHYSYNPICEDGWVIVWRIQLLGGLRLTYREQIVTTINTSRLQALLAYLALHTGVLQSREHLAFLFWPDSTDAQARTNLRQLLHHLRSALPDGGQFIETDSQTIRWRVTGEFAIDVADFENAASRADEAGKKGDVAALRESLEEAARLYNGDFLPGLLDEWAEQERNRLRQKYSDVLA